MFFFASLGTTTIRGARSWFEDPPVDACRATMYHLIFEESQPIRCSFRFRCKICDAFRLIRGFFGFVQVIALRKPLHTVDGKNPETGMVNIPFLQGFIHVRWCRMSSINSIYQASQQFFLEWQHKMQRFVPSSCCWLCWLQRSGSSDTKS